MPIAAGVHPYDSGDSTSSQDDLEMASGSSAKRPRARSNASQTSQAMNSFSYSRPHRLHPTRRISDPSAFSPRRSSHNLPPRGESYYPPSASSKRHGPRHPNSGRSSTIPSASEDIPPVPVAPRGLVTSSSHSLSSSNSDGTNRSGEVVDTPATAPSPEISPTTKVMPESFKFDDNEPAPRETYADVIPDFAPLGLGIESSGPAVNSEPTMPAKTHQRAQRSGQFEKERVTNFSRLSIRSNSSIVREPSHATRNVKINDTSQVAPATSTKPPKLHTSMSFERTPVNASTLPTRFIESGFDDPVMDSHRPTPQPPNTIPEPPPIPSTKRGKLTKRTSSSTSVPKAKDAQKAKEVPPAKEPAKSAKKSFWGRR